MVRSYGVQILRVNNIEDKWTVTSKHVSSDTAPIEETYVLIYALNKDSDQPAHPRSLIRVFVVRINKTFASLPIKRSPVKILGRVREGTGWSECSLDAHVQRYVFWHCGSYKVIMTLRTAKARIWLRSLLFWKGYLLFICIYFTTQGLWSGQWTTKTQMYLRGCADWSWCTVD